MGSVVKAIGNAKFHQGRVHGHSRKLHNRIIKYRIRFKVTRFAIINFATHNHNLQLQMAYIWLERFKLESMKLESYSLSWTGNFGHLLMISFKLRSTQPIFSKTNSQNSNFNGDFSISVGLSNFNLNLQFEYSISLFRGFRIKTFQLLDFPTVLSGLVILSIATQQLN